MHSAYTLAFRNRPKHTPGHVLPSGAQPQQQEQEQKFPGTFQPYDQSLQTVRALTRQLVEHLANTKYTHVHTLTSVMTSSQISQGSQAGQAKPLLVYGGNLHVWGRLKV